MTGRVLPTSRSTLAALVLGSAVIGWVVVRQFYGDIPRLRWYMPLWAGILSIAEVAFASTLRARINRKEGADLVDPIVAARALALAKASAYIGALTGGLWLGFAAYAGSQWGSLAAAKTDTVVALVGGGLGIALALAGLWLEHSCRVPRDDEDPRR